MEGATPLATVREDATWTPGPGDAQQAATLKSQVAGMLCKLKDAHNPVAKRAAELMLPMLTPGGGRSAGGDGPAPCTPGAGAPGASCASSCSYSSDGSHAAGADGGSLASSAAATPTSAAATASAALLCSEPSGSVAAGPASAGATPLSGAFNSPFSAAKKTLGKIFGASTGSADGSGQAGHGGSPTTGAGLIAAFRAIIPKTSNGSSGGQSPGPDAGGLTLGSH
jgi:hypothetical protein